VTVRKALLVIALLLLVLIIVRVAQGAPAPLTAFEKAKRVIWATFPVATRTAALRVAGCETGYTYNPAARNPSSGALGLFQFMPGNHRRIIRWGGIVMRLDYYRMYQPWYAARAALVLSQGGTNWREWACSP
jgi:hypothetical protein